MKRTTNSEEMTVISDYLVDGAHSLIVFRASKPQADIAEWLSENIPFVNSTLHEHGAILFRGFAIDNADRFETFLKAVSPEIMAYSNRSSPRHEIQNHIYTSTDHPNDQFINMHTEHSYSHDWPLKIVFCCTLPSQTGGQTPVADTRMVLNRLPEVIKNKFERKKILYVRNIGTGIGMGWREVFQTDKKEHVAAVCKDFNMDFQWLDEDQLRLRFVRPAIRKHPVTGQAVWFNHAFFFNINSIEDSIRKEIMDNGEIDILPFLTYYGDGSEIEPEVIAEIRGAYNEVMVKFDWEKGDVLLLDNMLSAHGRMPFTGPRQVLVGMLDPVNASSQ